MDVKFWTLALAAVLDLVSAAPSNAKTTLKTLYKFQGGADGYGPWGSLLINGSILYGVTREGGTNSAGTVFSFNLSTGTKTTLYTFMGGPDGETPLAGLTYLNGVLYGTTFNGGVNGFGSVFKLDPSSGQESVVYSFQGGSDGWGPVGPMMYAGSLLYGTTLFGGGGINGPGTLYSIDPISGAETVVSNSICNPEGQLANVNGIFWGSGACGNGTVFNVDPSSGVTQSLDLYEFASPYYAGPTYANGLLYGTTSAGGDLKCSQAGSGCGTLYSVDPTTYAIKVLYLFKGTGANVPFYSVVYNNGVLYGSTNAGAKAGGDLIAFDLTTKKLKVLYSFTGGPGSKSGYYPNQLIFSNGVLYGTTLGGGCSGGTCAGTIFSYTP